MKICHVCKAECDDTQELCPICGAQLLDNDTEAETKEAVIEDPTLLATVSDIVSAEIFKDVLKDSGIPFTCSSEMGNNSIQVLFGGGFSAEEFYVAESDLERATAVYEEFCASETEFDGEFDEEFFEEDAEISEEEI